MRSHGSRWLSAVLLASACGGAASAEVPPRPAASGVREDPRPGASKGALVVAHGGQGSPASRSGAVLAGAEAGFAALSSGAAALDAAMAAVRVLEDDPGFNAGRGANLRLDGRTIQCDAAVADDAGRFGAVAGLAGVRHPVDLARRVMDTPHLLIQGEGAARLARRLGLEAADLATLDARRKLARAMELLFSPPPNHPWHGFEWRSYWNFPTDPPVTLEEARARGFGSDAGGPPGRDTVGAVVRTADGRFAAALSTGGTALALMGRVGDVPQWGAGLYAGPHGAVAATGRGEAIVREKVAAVVYGHLARNVPARIAIRRAIRGIGPEEGVGVIAVSRWDHAAVATSQMAWAARGEEITETADTYVQRW